MERTVYRDELLKLHEILEQKKSKAFKELVADEHNWTLLQKWQKASSNSIDVYLKIRILEIEDEQERKAILQ